MNKKERVLFILFCLYFISLFLGRLINGYTVGMVVLGAGALLYGSFHRKIELLSSRSHLWFMLGFAAWLVISWFLSDNHQDGRLFLIRRIPLLVFPITLGLIEFKRSFRNRVILSFGAIVTLSALVSLFAAFYRYRQTGDVAWMYNDGLSYFIGQQSIYTSVFVNITIYIFTYFIVYQPLSKSRKSMLAVAIVFLLIFSYLLASRNMMMLLYITIIVFCFYLIIKRKKYLEGATLLMGLVVAGFLIFKFFPKTINRFRELAFTQFNYENRAKESHYNMELTAEQWNGANFRLAAWPCGWQLFREHPVTGVGIGDKKDKLFEAYREKQFHFALETRKNVHNNYLDILFSTGIIGFILFLTGWIVIPLFQSIRKSDGLTMLIIITIALAMITENYFDRSLGVMLAGFFIPFLMATKKDSTALQAY